MKKELTCNQVSALINFYLENKLNPKLKEYVDKHLEKCPNCKKKRATTVAEKRIFKKVLDKDIELRALRQAFGNGVDIMLYDIREELEKVIPAVKGKSLFFSTRWIQFVYTTKTLWA